jgi:putative nucleotidyltransferase with HDIG domain
VRAAERYRSAYQGFVHTLVEPIGKSYPQLKAHSLAVAALCRRMALLLHFSPDTVEQLTVAGLLHDIGLREIELPYDRIAGRRPLDLDEISIVRRHPVQGASMLDRIPFPYPIAPLVRHHHERFDGAGYPDHLAGDQIPLGARLIAIAEAYDAMTAPHSYRSPISWESALDIIESRAGNQFDPDLARRFASMIRTRARMEAAARAAPDQRV